MHLLTRNRNKKKQRRATVITKDGKVCALEKTAATGPDLRLWGSVRDI